MPGSHVFVSHSSSDYELVRRIREALEPRVKLWVDRRELVAGDELDPEIRAAIDESSHLITLLSLDALESDWVEKEVAYAREVRSRRGGGLPIIPVLVAPLKPKMVKWFLERDTVAIPLADVPGAFDRAVAELVVALGLELSADSKVAKAAEAKPLADLVLELTDPGIREAEGTRRATARARLTYRPADRSRKVMSRWFDFVAPLGPIEVDDLAWYLERYSAWPSEVFQRRAKEIEDKLPEWGQELYRAMAPEKAKDALDGWRGAGDASRRFSVVVEVDEEDDEDKDVDEETRKARAEEREGATLLLSLPWELVHDGRGYLFQGARGVRVRRQLPNRVTMPTLVTEPPIRVLLVSPRSEDDQARYIDHRISARPLVEVLEPLGEMVELSILQPPTFKALAAELSAARAAGRPYDVVHFDGHGVYDKRLGLGALCFEDPGDAARLTERGTATVQADKLAEIMRDHRVPLVFLEACQTAMSDVDPTGSVAGKLLAQGVASVVAMSHTVLVETARRFVGEFYRSLMKGERVGEAMLAGQCELANDTARGKSFDGELHLQDWFVPVLYQEEFDPPLIVELPTAHVQRDVQKRRELAFGDLPEEPDHHFVGRSRELLALERLLANERYVVILGEGGEGKTILAAELARWLVATRRFARAAFVSLEHALDARTVLFALGDQLVPGFAADAAKRPERAEQLAERALRERSTIVVLDNMETVLEPLEGAEDAGLFEPEVLEKILGLCTRLGEAGDTRLVFTSREALPEPFDHDVVRIGRLDRTDAVALVGNVLGKEDPWPMTVDSGESEDEIDRLVDAVNCHARCLVLVAREVAATGVQRATEQLEELMASMAERYGDDRERSLYASVELSLRRLPETTRRRLPRLGVFRGGGHLQAIGHVLGLDIQKDEEIDLGQQLVGVGLCEFLPYGHIHLHPALGPLLWRELDKAERQEARQAWVEVMARLTTFLRQQQSQDIQLSATLTLLELPNFLAALEYLQTTATAEQVVDFATTIEGLLQHLGRPRAMARAVRVREEVTKRLGEWSRPRFNAAFAAVDRLLEAGHVAEAVQEAQAVLERLAATGEHAYDGAAYDLAVAHFRLGIALRSGGAAEAALGSFAEARTRFLNLTGAGAARMAMKSLGETGEVLRVLGRLEEAAAAHEETIKLAEELGDRRGAAVARGNLGTVRMHQQRFDEALSAHSEARINFEHLGEPKSVALGWHQIGRVYQQAQQFGAAEDAYHHALQIRVQSGDRLGEAATLDQLGVVSWAMGRVEDAGRFHRQAAEIRSDFGDLMREGHSRTNAAIALIHLRSYDEARQEILRAIECMRPYGQAARPWKTFAILHDLEGAVGNASAAHKARANAIAAFVSYRRAGGENHTPSGRLAAAVAQAVTTGETAGVASQLSELVSRADLTPGLRALIPVLQQIAAGSRDPALASTPMLDYDDAAEIILLLERGGRSSESPVPPEGDEIVAGQPPPRPPEVLTSLDPKDRFRFSAFYPERVRARDVGKLIAFAHLQNVSRQVVKEAARRLDLPTGTKLVAKSDEPAVTVARESVIRVTPEIPGLRFELQEATMSLWEDSQSVEFRFRPEASSRGQACIGWVNFWLEGMILASLKVSVFVAEDDVPEIFQEDLEKVNARPYRRIFPSYSHLDSEVVDRLETYASSFGDEYLRDVRKLRSGQQWRDELTAFICRADVFQLFWSENAANSEYVEEEWRYALRERSTRADLFFVRPVYWADQPTPRPPEELQDIHFFRLPL